MDTDDPIVMYLVVRESLSLSPGKIGAQTGHAVQLFMEAYMPRKAFVMGRFGMQTSNLVDLEFERFRIVQEWLEGEYGKIVLRASDAEFEKVKLEHPYHVVVVDNGHTEVAPKTETVLGLWPMHKSERSKTLKRLQLL